MKHALSRTLALCFAVATSSKASSPPVKVSLRSSWPAPPLLAEILETVSLENPDAFFTYLDQLTDPNLEVTPSTLSPEAAHGVALDIAVSNGILKQPGSLSMVEMNLALHAATPKIEAFYQHYEDQHKHSPGAHCGSWVDWYGEVICDVGALKKLAGVETIDAAEKQSSSFPRPKILTFDHIYPLPTSTIERPPRTAILYASLTSSNFRELHTYLLSLASRPETHVEYVFRHIPTAVRDTTRSYLSGYGVSLDLKKTDYLAVDDRFSHSQKLKGGDDTETAETHSTVDPILSLIQAHPENATAPDAKTPLTKEELLLIGLQAAQIISESSTPLDTLTTLSQNFPKYATPLARRVVVNASLADELHANSLKAERGASMFWLNGAALNPKDVNPLALLRLLKKERNVISELEGLGLGRKEGVELLTHPSVAASQKDKAVLDGIFDASDRPEEGGVVVWWNNLEKDSRYARWNPSLYSLLQPMYPGQFPTIKLNIFNIIMVLDLSQTANLNFIAGAMSTILERNFPLRFGVVPVIETEESAQMARLFYHMINTYGRKKTLNFIKNISQIAIHPALHTPTVDWHVVRAAFEEVVETEETPEDAATELDDIIKSGISSETPVEKINSYTERLGATLSTSPQGHVFFNGKHFNMNDDFIRLLQAEFSNQMAFFMEKIYEGTISDDQNLDMANYFYDLPTTSKRRNTYIFPSKGSLRILNLPELWTKTRFRISASDYVYPAKSQSVPISLYVVGDLDSSVGRNMIGEAVNFINNDAYSRVSFIHNPTDSAISVDTTKSTSLLISHLLSNHLLGKASPAHLLRALKLHVSSSNEEGNQESLSHEEIMLELTGGADLKDVQSENVYSEYVKRSQLVVRGMQLLPGQLALVVNGRVVGPIGEDGFSSADFKALEEYELRKRTEPVLKALKSMKPEINDLDKGSFSDLISMASSIVAATQLPDPSEVGLLDAPLRPRQRLYQLLESNYTAFEFGDITTALYHVVVLVDPVSETAQRWSSLLKWLSNIPDIFIKIHINPARFEEVPLKRFYRYNLLPSLTFDDAGLEIPAQAIFEDLPLEPIYTLAMDVPQSWLVRPREALYDLDNIQLGNLSPEDKSLDAVFELDYLVVEGHAREVYTNAPPRGVQLQLITSDGTPIADTQVVANLGYLQFKAKPGVFKLEIREGRGRKIFKMESVGNEGWDSPSVDEVGSEITLTNFEGLTLYPTLSRLPGMETADVLEEPTEETSSGSLFEDMASRVMSIFKSKKEEPSTELQITQQADINIFTVASGLLYERFVGIMILSVLRNTNSTVKFWFIENFLSPSFLEFIPHMAEKYNFQYELVTYKWPSWLRAQTEKQRIIWAYKILFLDVLFPMDLKKVIFVDADQIVRADLKELVDLDLNGAPYGYTPMGDDNEEMEGFRFWKSGYWKDYLKGRPYHISALYVIDLVRFRQLAAGDILRGQYQGLSADKNSLANLDQDLPNNLQTEVPIFSLDKDWLWCETWCSKDRLDTAKTIDLCQNPLTKEPKLARARQIPEWEEYDSEIARFTRQLAEEGKIRSRLATADVNALAGAGSSASTVSDSGEDNTSSSTVVDTETQGIPQRDEL